MSMDYGMIYMQTNKTQKGANMAKTIQIAADAGKLYALNENGAIYVFDNEWEELPYIQVRPEALGILEEVVNANEQDSLSKEMDEEREHTSGKFDSTWS